MMPAEVVNRWLLSGKYTSLNGMDLQPRAHPKMPKTPLSAVRGQAEAFYLKGPHKERFILKKFHSNCEPEENYLQKIRGYVPQRRGTESATQRLILDANSLDRKKNDQYFSAELKQWICKTILMPQVPGYAWADFADSVRDETFKLSYTHRIKLCYDLTQHIRALERAHCCHRDLSAGNVFIDPTNLQVHLIDWDSFFRKGLTMPHNTTCGTEGYIAPFIPKDQFGWDPRASWCIQADRFALAIVNAEFLCISAKFAPTHDGGIFDQEELSRRKGKVLKKIRKELAAYFPRARELFDQALAAKSFAQCPAPDDWLAFCRESLPDSLEELGGADTQRMIRILKMQRKKKTSTKGITAAVVRPSKTPPPPAPTLPKPPNLRKFKKMAHRSPHTDS